MPEYLPVTVETPCPVPPARAFDVIAPIDLTVIFTGWGPLPGVRAVQSGPWDAAGRVRTVELTDSSTAVERITEYTPPHSFAYELGGFTGVLGRLVSHVRGEWTFTPDGVGCVVRWTYAFYPRRGLLVRWVLVPLWRRYAAATLDRAVAAASV
jgi:hypothetical protein